MGLCIAAIVGQIPQHRIAGEICTTFAILNQVVTVYADCALFCVVVCGAERTFSSLPGVVSDDRVLIVQMSQNMDSPTSGRGAVVSDGTIDEPQGARQVNPTPLVRSAIAADGAVGEHRGATTADVDTTSPVSPQSSAPGLVAADGTVYEHQTLSPALDTTPRATFETAGGFFVGDVIGDGAVDDR